MSSNGLNHFGSGQGQIPLLRLCKRIFPVFVLVTASFVVCPNPALSQALTVIDKDGALMPVWADKTPVHVAPAESVKPQEAADIQPLEVVPIEESVQVKPLESQEIPVSKELGCQQKFSSRKQGQSLSISQGDYISKQLNEWARFHGYDLVWEADEFMAQGAVTFDGSFDETLEKFRESMEENGIRLDVLVYRNCVVRISLRK